MTVHLKEDGVVHFNLVEIYLWIIERQKIWLASWLSFPIIPLTRFPVAN